MGYQPTRTTQAYTRRATKQRRDRPRSTAQVYEHPAQQGYVAVTPSHLKGQGRCDEVPRQEESGSEPQVADPIQRHGQSQGAGAGLEWVGKGRGRNACPVHSRFGSGSVPARFLVRSGSCSGLVDVWFRFGSCPVRFWFGSGSVPVRFRLADGAGMSRGGGARRDKTTDRKRLT